VKTGATYQFLWLRCSAFGTGDTFLVFTDLHEALEDMLADIAFKFIDRHERFPQSSFDGKLTYSPVTVK
jgi:hypothetical protein